MAKKMVKYHDLDTQKTVEIPSDELSSTSIGANVQGVGNVWIDGDRIKLSPRRHSRLPEELRATIRQIAGILADVYPQPIEQWEDGFLRDAQPETEVAVWRHIATVFQAFTNGKRLPLDQRKEFLRVFLGCSMSPDGSADMVLDTAELKVISREEAMEAIRLYAVMSPKE